MSSRTSQDGAPRGRNWDPLLTEILATASSATWGLWVLCVLLLVTLSGALGIAAAHVVF